MKKYLLILSFTTLNLIQGQEKKDLYKIIDEVSSERIEKDIRKLVSFGTRHTLSDTISKKEGLELPEDGLNPNLKKFQMIVIIVWKYFIKKIILHLKMENGLLNLFGSIMSLQFKKVQ